MAGTQRSRRYLKNDQQLHRWLTSILRWNSIALRAKASTRLKRQWNSYVRSGRPALKAGQGYLLGCGGDYGLPYLPRYIGA